MAVVGGRRAVTHWPLTAVIAGLPVWWILGLAGIVPILAAIPMLWQLLARHPVRLPRGHVWWFLFLLWVALGLMVLFAEAPGSAPGGGSARLLVFGYRLAWYLACTVVLLWIGNTDREELSDRRVHGLMALLFCYTVLGGFLGLVAPTLEFRTPFESLLPGGLRSNGFVSSLVHLEVADVQDVLGHAEARPKAPFSFTNTWGSVISLCAAFLVGLAASGRRALLVPCGLVLLAAVVPIVYSLNRGVWAAVVLGAVGVVALAVFKRRHSALLALGLVAVIAGVVFFASPLAELSSQRLDSPHSNARRGQLAFETMASATSGSPILGFGSTRDVQGSFSSIAGGPTPDCPACAPPPLGTQGQLWLVIFSQGWPGVVFFLGFLLSALARCMRCRTVNETVCCFVIAIFLLQLAIYDTLGLPLYIVMVAIALVWREQALSGVRRQATLEDAVAELRRAAPLTALLAVVGATAGGVWTALLTPPVWQSSVAMVITPAPLYLDAGVLPSDDEAQETATTLGDVTLDTEAALLMTQASLSRASHATGIPAVDLRSSVGLTAEPNSRVLVVTARQPSSAAAESAAAAVADSYLTVRRDHLEQRRAHLVARLYDELGHLPANDPSTLETRIRYLTTAIDHLRSTTPMVGYVYRLDPAHPAPANREVPVGSGLALGVLAGLVLGTLRRPKVRA